MPEIIEFNLPISNRTDPQLQFNTRSGGVALNGAEQILTPLSARWTFSAVIPIFKAGHARSIRTIKSRLKGRTNYLLMRVCDQYRINRREVGAFYPGSQVPHSDQTTFSDGSAYALANPISPATVASPIRSSQIVVRAMDFAGAMTAGVFFSIDNYLYQVDNWEESGSNYILQISPPLRKALAVDDEVDFDAKCLWRLASDDEGQLNLLIGRFGEVVLNLVEPIPR